MKISFYFEDVFPNYQTFKQFTDELGIVKPELEFLNEKCYNFLLRKFSHCNLAYSEPGSFLNEFALAYEENFKQFAKRNHILEIIEKLSDEDYLLINESINNSAKNPNSAVANAKTPLNYVTGQIYSISKASPLLAYINALNNIPTQRIYEFLNSFNYLTLQIITGTTPIYYNEEV